MEEQTRLDKIHYWLSRTTEQFDDWWYDGQELVIILKGKEIERYNNKVIDNFLGITN